MTFGPAYAIPRDNPGLARALMLQPMFGFRAPGGLIYQVGETLPFQAVPVQDHQIGELANLQRAQQMPCHALPVPAP